MRITKEPEERKSEILDAAEQLFATKGYAKTTIVHILNEVGIAKGTFYYHFKSKEEVMDAIIMRIINNDVASAKNIADRTDLSATDKLFQTLFALKPYNSNIKSEMIEQFHQPANAEMHQKSLVASIQYISPFLADAVRQGIDEGIMATEYPQEAVEFLLASAQVLLDEGLFQWDQEQLKKKVESFISIMETVLGAEKGTFSKMVEILT